MALDGQCRVCSTKLRFVKLIRGEESGAPTPLLACPACRSFFSRLEYTQQTHDDIRADSIDDYVESEAYLRKRVRGVLTHASNMRWTTAAGNRLLDIGCGVGWSLVVAQEMGFRASGVEPMTEAAAYATRTLKLDVVNALFSHELFVAGTFDFVILDQVLEHVPDPLAMLRDIMHLLKAGGIVFLGVPPVDWSRRMTSVSLQLPIAFVAAIESSRLRNAAALVGKHDTFRFPEGHISYFSSEAIGILATRCGARVLGQHHAQRLRTRCFPALRLSTGSFFLRKD